MRNHEREPKHGYLNVNLEPPCSMMTSFGGVPSETQCARMDEALSAQSYEP